LLVSYRPLASKYAPGSAQRAAPPPLPPERELPAPKTPPDSLRTTFTLTRPSAWPPRARRPSRPSRPVHAGLPRLPRPSPVSADAGRGWAKSSHAPWPSVWARPRRAHRGNNRSRAPPSGVFAGSGPPRKQGSSSSLGIPARVPGSRPPIAADVGGLEPSAPRVASDGQTLSHGQSSHLFVPSALWES
jgi:hypothetical protein